MYVILDALHTEIKCVDQAQFDLYLASVDNWKLTLDSMNAEPDTIAAWSETGITYTVAIVENTNTSSGLLSLDDLAEILYGYVPV